MERTRRRLVLAILVITGSGCSVLPVASPSTVVGAALDAVADHDLARANAQVCPEARDVTRLPFPITGIVLPLGSIADLPMDRALEVVTIELGDLQATESVDGDQAQVHVTGAFGLQFSIPRPPAPCSSTWRRITQSSMRPGPTGSWRSSAPAASRSQQTSSSRSSAGTARG
ncbi:MAG: hypothetical protein A2V85_16025 [Chloroflexi bacterium RBG_16_72_14]|nr:MAG: hypothetical protein A2V85_16025 [Chloroflexi bacterium RBG_16_72_14]